MADFTLSNLDINVFKKQTFIQIDETLPGTNWDSNKGCWSTTVDNVKVNDFDTGLTISATPYADAEVQVFVNGVRVEVGDGDKHNTTAGDNTAACYFSGDNGETARLIDNIEIGDKFYWNTIIAGYALDYFGIRHSSNDDLDFAYFLEDVDIEEYLEDKWVPQYMQQELSVDTEGKQTILIAKEHSVSSIGGTLVITLNEPYKNVKSILSSSSIVKRDRGTISGTVSGAKGTDTIFGTNVSFNSDVAVGDIIWIDSKHSYVISTISGDTLAIVGELKEGFSNATYFLGESDDTKFDKFFRWSIDNDIYSEYFPLDDLTLQNLELDPKNDFWIEYKFEAADLEQNSALSIVSISLEVETNDGILSIMPQIEYAGDYFDPAGFGNLIIEEINTDNVFKPYDLGRADKVYAQLVGMTSDIFGHDVKYFRVVANERSKDVILHEYSLKSVAAIGDIKIMVPNNEFPTQELQYNPFGIDFDEFEIHVTKKAFQEIFGAKTEPRVDDYLYLPIMNRMYLVNSVIPADEFNVQHTFYRLQLNKYEDKASIVKSDEVQEEMNDLITGVDAIFGEEVQEEFEKSTKPLQYSTIGAGKDDFVRSDISGDLSIIDEDINNSFTIVSKNHYDLSNISNNNIAIKYRASSKQTHEESRAYSFWFRSHLQADNIKDVSYSLSDSGYVQLSSPYFDNVYTVGDFVELKQSGQINGLFQVREVISDTKYMLDWAASAVPATGKAIWKDVVTPICSNTDDVTKGISIKIMRGFLAFIINNDIYKFETLTDYENDTWHAFIINHNNIFNQLGVFLYHLDTNMTQRSWVQGDTNLVKDYRHTVDINPLYDIKEGINWAVLGGNIDLTNLRIFNKPLDEEQHSNILNQYVVRDSDKAILIDNALPQVKLMRLANNR